MTLKKPNKQGKRFTVRKTEVIAVEVFDRPGDRVSLRS
jgi:hypothetical protein